jgi:hypothetical protein
MGYNMIEVGDKVRFSNEFIAKHNLFAPGQRKGRQWYKRRRGEQKIMTVLAVRNGVYDWRIKKYTGDLVLIEDVEDKLIPIKWLNAYWLKVVRKGTKTQPSEEIPF